MTGEKFGMWQFTIDENHRGRRAASRKGRARWAPAVMFGLGMFCLAGLGLAPAVLAEAEPASEAPAPLPEAESNAAESLRLPGSHDNGGAENEPAEASTQQATGTASQIDRLIEQLGDPKYRVRQQAQSRLFDYGFEAFEALRKATNHEDLEVATRAEYILARLHVDWTEPGDPESVQRLMSSYGDMSFDERSRVIEELVALPGLESLPALIRIARYETSPVLARQAVLQTLAERPIGPLGRGRFVEALSILDGLELRPPASWLQAFRQMYVEPEKGLPRFAELIEVAQDGSASLTGPSNIRVLLYELAQAQREAGQEVQGDLAAARARDVYQTAEADVVRDRLDTGYRLRNRGLFDWAKDEFRAVIEANVAGLEIFAYSALAEMHHDQGNDEQAAETWREYFELKPATPPALSGRLEINEYRARMHYFRACHFEELDDREKQIEELDTALSIYPSEIDTLIARYRLLEEAEKDNPEERQRIRELIDSTVQQYRNEITQAPERAAGYNQLAWLLSNTYDEFGEAVRLAQQAVTLQPDTAAYHDTLARAYYSQGRLREALRAQARARELEPYSGLLQKQLDFFQAEWDERFPDRPLPIEEPPDAPNTSGGAA